MNPFLKLILIIFTVVFIVWAMDTLMTEHVLSKFTVHKVGH
jgi:hypothetical protein